MTDNKSKTPEGESLNKQQGKVVKIERIYLRDLSFELPNASNIWGKKWQPKIDLRLNNNSTRLEKNIYECILKITVTAKNNGKIAFIAEIEQAASFYIANLTRKELNHALVVAAPNILFPYVRETLDSMLLKGGLPPMHLAQINFQAMYEARKKQERDEAGKMNLDNPDGIKWEDINDEDVEVPPKDKLN